MTFESMYDIVIATLSNWLKNLAPVFQPLRSIAKTSRTFYARFLSLFEQARNSDYFWIAPVVIGLNNYFGIVFRLLFDNRARLL